MEEASSTPVGVNARITGPAVLGAQASFVEDWNWAQRAVLELSWPLEPDPAGGQPRP